uniref:Ig-like domain-containing protein n=1 Tax=Cyprinus carpio TaxID=7962 RepID=A0A8C1WUJ5_CYPCA
MSSVKVMLVVSLFIPAVRPGSGLFELECLPAVGILAQTTVIRCFFKDIKDIQILGVYLTKAEEKEPFFHQDGSERSGDPRFSVENLEVGPSLQISDTTFSDEGKYRYRVVTDSGVKEIQLSISVTAKYKDPVTSIWPENVIDGGSASLYCNATDGYPEGFIHWFDRYETNWTVNSEMTKVPKNINGVKSVALSSKLTFKTINLGLEPFRCIVFNSKYVKDGENTLGIISAISDVNKKSSSGSNTTNIVAGVMVIGSLIAGLLFALLCFRKRKDKDTFNIHSNGNKGTTYIYSYFILYTHFSDYVCMRDFCETHAFYLLTYLVAKREVLSWLNLERTSLSRARIGEFLCYLKTSNSRDSLPYHDLLNVFKHNMTVMSLLNYSQLHFVKWCFHFSIILDFVRWCFHFCKVTFNLMLIFSTYKVILNPSYLPRVFNFIRFVCKSASCDIDINKTGTKNVWT